MLLAMLGTNAPAKIVSVCTNEWYEAAGKADSVSLAEPLPVS